MWYDWNILEGEVNNVDSGQPAQSALSDLGRYDLLSKNFQHVSESRYRRIQSVLDKTDFLWIRNYRIYRICHEWPVEIKFYSTSHEKCY